MEPITVAQLAMLLVVGFLLFRTQSGPPAHRGWRGFRRDPSIFPVMLEARERRRLAGSQRAGSSNLPSWFIPFAILVAGALVWSLTR